MANIAVPFLIGIGVTTVIHSAITGQPVQPPDYVLIFIESAVVGLFLSAFGK